MAVCERESRILPARVTEDVGGQRGSTVPQQLGHGAIRPSAAMARGAIGLRLSHARAHLGLLLRRDALVAGLLDLPDPGIVHARLARLGTVAVQADRVLTENHDGTAMLSLRPGRGSLRDVVQAGRAGDGVSLQGGSPVQRGCRAAGQRLAITPAPTPQVPWRLWSLLSLVLPGRRGPP